MVISAHAQLTLSHSYTINYNTIIQITSLADLPTITHWAWMYTHSNLLKHPRTLEFNPRIHLIGVAVDSLVPERVPSSSRTPGYAVDSLAYSSLRNYCAVRLCFNWKSKLQSKLLTFDLYHNVQVRLDYSSLAA